MLPRHAIIFLHKSSFKVMEFQKSHRQRLAAANEKKVIPFALIILTYLFFVSCKTANRNYHHVRSIICQHVNDFDANHSHYNFLKFDWCINCFIFHELLYRVEVGQLAVIGYLKSES